MTVDLAVVTAADSIFFDLLQGMVRSLRDKPQGRDCALYIIDIGLDAEQRRWLLTQGARLFTIGFSNETDGIPRFLSAFLARCGIPEHFPGHEIYLWIDADAWICSWDAVDAYIEGALRTGFAITAESDPAYNCDQVLATHQQAYDVPARTWTGCDHPTQ